MKQTWGLIIADSNEIHNLNFKFIKETKVNKLTFFHYEWREVEIIVVESKIGIVNAAMVTQILVDIYKINKVLNYGAVGASNKLKLFDVVIPEKFYFYDVETPWYPRGQTPGEKSFYLNSFKDTDKINIGTGNSFIFKEEQLSEIKKELNIDLFDMEVCAIAQVCSKNDILFFSIKGVSDIIGATSESKQNINDNIAKASKKALEKLLLLLDKILII